MKPTTIHILTFATVAIFASACGNKEEQAKENNVYPVVKVSTKAVALPNEYVAKISAVQNVELRARVTGYLEQILVDEGSQVKEGQVLFQLNDREYRNSYEQAMAAHKSALAEASLAELEVERTKLMVEKKVLSDIELRVVTVKWNSLKARAEETLASLKHAEIKLLHTKIKAPFSGVIDRIPYKRGSLIQEGDVLTSVSDNGSVFAYFNVSEREYLRLMQAEKVKRAEQEVLLKLADGNMYPLEGKVETMAGDFDSNTGSIAFRARFKNPDLLLRHGATATVVIENIQPMAMVVPQRSTFEIQDKTFVFAVDQSNHVKMKSIVPKSRLEDVYVVESGLKPNEMIVYEGIQYLKDGMAIQPKLLKMDSLMAVTK